MKSLIDKRLRMKFMNKPRKEVNVIVTLDGETEELDAFRAEANGELEFVRHDDRAAVSMKVWKVINP